MGPQILAHKESLNKTICGSADQHRIGCRQPLETRRYVGRLAQCQLFLTLCSTHFPNNNQSSMNPYTNGEVDTWSLLQTAIECSHGRKHP